MKKLIIFTGIILGIIFFIQCDKTTEIKDYPNDNLESRTESALTNAIVNNNDDKDISVVNGATCRLEDVEGFSCYIVPDVYIYVELDAAQLGLPPDVVGDCGVFAGFDIKICQNGYNYLLGFMNFKLFIPEGGDCENLNDYLNDLENTDVDAYNDAMDNIRLFVAEAAKAKKMINFVETNQVYCPDFAAEAQLFMTLCYKKCLEPDKMIKVCGPQLGNEDCKDPQYIIIGGEYKFIPCGEGCCITTQEYCYDKENDTVIIGDKTTFTLGSCDENGNITEVCFGSIKGGPHCITGGCN